jgi:prevent-host-death family protein
MSMKTVSVASFKQNLSQYLHLVAEGHEVVVTSHQRPVARVIAESTGLAIRPPSRPVASLRAVEGVTISAPGLALEILLADRQRR